MNDLELCKKFAELDNVNTEVSVFSSESVLVYKYMGGDKCHLYNTANIYNPIADLALNCAAIIKYRLKVEPEYDGEWYATRCDGGWSKRQASKTKDASLQRAVVACILKSEGLL